METRIQFKLETVNTRKVITCILLFINVRKEI